MAVLVVVLLAVLVALWSWALRAAARRSWPALVGVTLALAVLVYPVLAGLPALVHVCDSYERRGFLDCGGVDGSQEQVRLAGAVYGVLLLGHTVAAAWWFSRSPPRTGAHLRRPPGAAPRRRSAPASHAPTSSPPDARAASGEQVRQRPQP